jgi:hypothetical protein
MSAPGGRPTARFARFRTGRFQAPSKRNVPMPMLSPALRRGRLRAGLHRLLNLSELSGYLVVSGLVRRGQTYSEYHVRCRLRTAERSARPLGSRSGCGADCSDVGMISTAWTLLQLGFFRISCMMMRFNSSAVFSCFSVMDSASSTEERWISILVKRRASYIVPLDSGGRWPLMKRWHFAPDPVSLADTYPKAAAAHHRRSRSALAVTICRMGAIAAACASNA